MRKICPQNPVRKILCAISTSAGETHIYFGNRPGKFAKLRRISKTTIFLTAVSLPCTGLSSPSQWQPRLPGRHERDTRATIRAIAAAHQGSRSERRRTDSEDGPAVRSTQTKVAARRDAQTARKRRSRAADAAAAPAERAASASRFATFFCS